MTRAVVAFGRMNPPTVGHEKLAKKVSDEARKRKAMPHIYLSHSQDKKKNPLNYNDKIKYATKAFGKMVIKSSARSIIEVFKELEKMDHTEVVLVAGSDRIVEFNTLLQKYNGKEYNFKKIEVISAGERDPDSEGVEGMSGTKLRNLAKSGDFDTFKTGLASKLRDADKKKIYNIIRSVVEEVELDEYNTKSSRAIVLKDNKPIAIYPDLKSAQKDWHGKPGVDIGIRSYSASERIRKSNPGIKLHYSMTAGGKWVKEEVELEEGVNDPGIFKAVFLAGGPGSGKSFIVGNTGLSSFGLKLVNVDDVFEKALKKAGLDTSPENIMSPKGQEIRVKSKKITVNKEFTYLKGRLGLIIDGTGKNFNKINAHAKLLKKMGYETAMIFVNTNLETALDRNKKRPRTLPDKNVEKMWKSVQDNIGKFQNSFGINFTIVDNSEGVDWESNALNAYKKISKWVKMSPSSKIAKNWISQGKSRRGINEAYEVYLEEKNTEKLGDLIEFGRFKTGLASKLGDTDKMKNIIRSVNEASDEDTDDDNIPEFSDKDLDDIYDELMSDEEDEEDWDEDTDFTEAVLTLQQRMKRRLLMRRLGPKIARKRKIALRRKANKHQLQRRARKAAVLLLKKRVAGKKGASYKTLKPSEKISIDRLVSKKMGMVPAIARRLLPMITKKEMKRFANLNKNKNEEFTNYLDEAFTNYLFELYFKVDVEGLPSVYIEAPSAGTIKSDLRKLIRNPGENIHSIDRVGRGEIVKAFRLRARNPSDPLEIDEDLEEKSIKSGVPFDVIREVYRRGMKSYESNMRPDTTPQQWAYARVNSYIAGGKTGDADLTVSETLSSLNEASSVPNIKKGDWITVSKAKRPFTAAGVKDPKRMEPASSEKMYVHKIIKSKVHLRYDSKSMKGYAINLDKMPDFLSIKIVESLNVEFEALIEKESNQSVVRGRHRKEREAMKREFDSELDAARLRDTKIANNKNEEFEALISESQNINQD